MIQSRLESLAESALDITLGFIMSMLVWIFIVAPIIGVERQMGQAFWITGVFTVSSLLRRYYTRRFFANSIHKKIHHLVTKWVAKYK